ncbi:hypothetical protein AAFO90_09475, partial [Phaeobacter sp. CAU 1743]
MTEKSATSFVLNHDRLASASDDYAAEPTFKACLNAHGMYETMRFVLRLSPRNHELMERIESNEFETSAAPADVVQAYSTYIHETIHWWQHVGSTSGLLFSLSLNRPGFAGEFFVQNLGDVIKSVYACVESFLHFLRRPIADGAM